MQDPEEAHHEDERARHRLQERVAQEEPQRELLLVLEVLELGHAQHPQHHERQEHAEPHPHQIVQHVAHPDVPRAQEAVPVHQARTNEEVPEAPQLAPQPFDGNLRQPQVLHRSPGQTGPLRNEFRVGQRALIVRPAEQQFIAEIGVELHGYAHALTRHNNAAGGRQLIVESSKNSHKIEREVGQRSSGDIATPRQVEFMDYLDEGDHREAEGGEDEPRLEHDVLLGECEGDDSEIDDIASFVELLRDDVEGEDRDHGHHHVLDGAEVVLLLQLG